MKTNLRSLVLCGIVLLTPSAVVQAQSRITQAFDDPSSAAAYCAQHYSPNDVVRKDNITTSQKYSQTYTTWYIREKLPNGAPNPNFPPNAPNFAGSYYCYAEAVLSGWKDSSDPNANPNPVDFKELFQQPKTLDSSSTLADATSVCGSADNVVWQMDQLSHDIQSISGGPYVTLFVRYADRSDPYIGSMWQKPPTSGSAASYTHHFNCANQLPTPNEDYKIYDANERANAAALQQQHLQEAQAIAAQQAAAQQAAAQQAAQPQGIRIDRLHDTATTVIGSQVIIVRQSDGTTDAYRFNPSAVKAENSGGGSYTITTPDGAKFVASGVISNDGNSVIRQDGSTLVGNSGGTLVAAGGGNVVALGAGNLVAAGGGNLVAAGGGNLVAAGGGNIIAPSSSLISQGAAEFTRAIAQLISNAQQIASTGSANAISNTTAGLTNLAQFGGVMQNAASFIGHNGSAAISDNGAGLVTDNGAGLVTDNGSGLITENGAGILTDQGAGLTNPTGGGAPGSGFTQSSTITAFSNSVGTSSNFWPVSPNPATALQAAMRGCGDTAQTSIDATNVAFALAYARKYARLSDVPAQSVGPAIGNGLITGLICRSDAMNNMYERYTGPWNVQIAQRAPELPGSAPAAPRPAPTTTATIPAPQPASTPVTPPRPAMQQPAVPTYAPATPSPSVAAPVAQPATASPIAQPQPSASTPRPMTTAPAPAPAASPAPTTIPAPTPGAAARGTITNLHEYAPGNARGFFLVTDSGEAWHFTQNDVRAESTSPDTLTLTFSRDGSRLTARQTPTGVSTDHGNLTLAGVGPLVSAGSGYTTGPTALVARDASGVRRILASLAKKDARAAANGAPAAPPMPSPAAAGAPTPTMVPPARRPNNAAPAPAWPAPTAASPAPTGASPAQAPALPTPASAAAPAAAPASVAPPAAQQPATAPSAAAQPTAGRNSRNNSNTTNAQGSQQHAAQTTLIDPGTAGNIAAPDAPTIARMGLTPFMPNAPADKVMFFASAAAARQAATQRGEQCTEVFLMRGKVYAMRIPESQKSDVVGIGCARDANRAKWTPRFY